MAEVVFDSSALLAIILQEPAEQIDQLLERSIISAVNLAEVWTKLIDLEQIQVNQIAHELTAIVSVVEFDGDQAMLAASLRQKTRHAGLSLGDRACLALAISKGAEVYTADRNWLRIEVPCIIHMIR